MKKIVLGGTISAGKTTTLNCLKPIFETLNPLDRTIAEPGPLVHFVGEAARTVFENFSGLPRDDYNTDLRIAHKIISNEMTILADTRAQTLVCDRSVIDVFVFAATHEGGHLDTLMENKLLVEYMKSYNRYLLFSPTGVPYVQEGVRIEGMTFRDKLHKTFIAMLDELGIQYNLVEGSVSQRVSKVLSIILEEHYG